MMTSLAGTRCLITGAASGIGRATALAAAASGARVLLTDIHEAQLEEAAAAVRAAGGTVAFSGCADVSDEASVDALAAQIHADGGSVDIVMNIAGVSTWGAVEALSMADWRRMIDINLLGPIHIIHAFIPPMIEAGCGGHLVNVSSAAGLFGLPWHAAYSASKFGIRGVSEVLRFDLRQHGIRVSLVCPGAVDTPLVGTVDIVGIDRSDPKISKAISRFSRHAATPEQAAAAIIRGVERDHYMVYTSRDIRIGFWIQRKFALPYELFMRVLNTRVVRMFEGSSTRAE